MKSGVSTSIINMTEARFHLLIDQLKVKKIEANILHTGLPRQGPANLPAIGEINQNPNQRRGRGNSVNQPQVPLTKDEILVTKKFLKYEKKLLKEYVDQVLSVELDKNNEFTAKAKRHDRAYSRPFAASEHHSGYH